MADLSKESIANRYKISEYIMMDGEGKVTMKYNSFCGCGGFKIQGKKNVKKIAYKAGCWKNCHRKVV